MAKRISYRVYLSQIASKEWYNPNSRFLPKLVLQQYDIGFEIVDDVPTLMRICRGKVNPIFGWALQNIDTGDVFTNTLDLCVDIKNTQCIPL